MTQGTKAEDRLNRGVSELKVRLSGPGISFARLREEKEDILLAKQPWKERQADDTGQ